MPSDPLVPFTDQLRLAVAAYLARFKGSSREHTESDLRCYLAWCAERGLDPLAAMVILVASTILVIGAGAIRPFVPDLEAVASGLQRLVYAADPVPAGAGAFRVLERAVTLASSGFSLFEQRAGVWLATIFIVALLVWSSRQ